MGVRVIWSIFFFSEHGCACVRFSFFLKIKIHTTPAVCRGWPCSISKDTEFTCLSPSGGFAGGIMFQVSAPSLHSEPSWDIIFDQVPFTCVLLPPFWADGAYRGPWSTD
jgi:hypothetical protein